MKKTYLYIIIVLLIVAFAFYIYTNNQKSNVATTLPPTSDPSTGSGQATTPGTPVVAVAGMKEYTDAAFGFSFWYPSTWQVTVPTNPPFGATLQGGSVVATLGLQPTGQTYPSILIKEFRSATTSITDTGGAGPIGPVTYFFDATTHTWMTTSNEATGSDVTKAADISNNSMGGLHLFGGTSRFDTAIIPLSAKNFVVINDGGGADATALEKTVTATDPAVATPVSAAQQIQTIQAEQSSIQPS